MNYTVTFTPFESNSNAQITTTATVSLTGGEVLWSEPVIVGIRAGMMMVDVEHAVTQAVSGFAARVEAILLAREFQGIIPELK